MLKFASVTLQRRETSMLAYISIGIGVCNIVLGLVFYWIWTNLRDRIKYSIALQQEFQKAARRTVLSIGLFGIPIILYLFSDIKEFPNEAEPYALGWQVCCVVSLLSLVASLATLLRYGKR
jgi:hypothetical protein